MSTYFFEYLEKERKIEETLSRYLVKTISGKTFQLKMKKLNCSDLVSFKS